MKIRMQKKPFEVTAERFIDGYIPDGVELVGDPDSDLPTVYNTADGQVVMQPGVDAWLPGRQEAGHPVHPGDWVLSFDNGFRCVLKDEFLRQQYEELQ